MPEHNLQKITSRLAPPAAITALFNATHTSTSCKLILICQDLDISRQISESLQTWTISLLLPDSNHNAAWFVAEADHNTPTSVLPADPSSELYPLIYCQRRITTQLQLGSFSLLCCQRQITTHTRAHTHTNIDTHIHTPAAGLPAGPSSAPSLLQPLSAAPHAGQQPHARPLCLWHLQLGWSLAAACIK